MPINITNYNVSTINNLSNSSDSLSNITISNSIKISKSANTTNNSNDNKNAGIFIKDINSNGSGNFYRLHVDSSLNDSPVLYFNNNEVIDTSNLLAELEDILQYQTLDVSNIMITGGYLNFSNGSQPNTNQGDTGVGIRYSSNNMVQFKNYDTDWIDLVDIIHHDEFKELKDVDVYSNPLENKQYITYNSNNQKFVNTTLAIVNDPNPTLGGDLNIGDYLLRFSDEYNRFVYNSNGIIDNNLLVLKNNTTMTNDYSYIEIGNADITGELNPSITAKSTYNLDVGININTLNAGNIELNATQGNVNVNANNLIIANNLVVNNSLVVNSNIGVKNVTISGYSVSSIYRTSNKPGGYTPETYWNTPILTDTILYNFSNSSTYGTYYSNIGAGVDGQKLNLVFNNSNVSNVIDVKVFFGQNKILVGSGFASILKFDTSGQSSSLMYLGEDINCWQALNTGAALF
jgi:hypothetical protein